MEDAGSVSDDAGAPEADAGAGSSGSGGGCSLTASRSRGTGLAFGPVTLGLLLRRWRL